MCCTKNNIYNLITKLSQFRIIQKSWFGLHVLQEKLLALPGGALCLDSNPIKDMACMARKMGGRKLTIHPLNT